MDNPNVGHEMVESGGIIAPRRAVEARAMDEASAAAAAGVAPNPQQVCEVLGMVMKLFEGRRLDPSEIFIESHVRKAWKRSIANTRAWLRNEVMKRVAAERGADRARGSAIEALDQMTRDGNAGD